MNHRIQSVTELRREGLFDRFHTVGLMILLYETDRRTIHHLRPGIGGHNQDNITKICLTTIVVGQGAVIHDLQKQVENIRMAFLDFVEQQYTVGGLVDGFG